MKTLVVDDSKLNREGLINILENNFPVLNIIGEANSIESSIEQINKLNPELVFLDIELGDGTAFTLLKQLNKVNFSIIFVTAYNKYAIEAFEANAVDYLLKPINIDRLIKAVKKVINQQNQFQINSLINSFRKEKVQSTFISIATQNEFEYINTSDIIRFEADGKYTKCILDKKHKSIISSDNLGKFEKELDLDIFIRTHHSHLISRDKIKKFSKKDLTVTMTNGDVIPISQRKKEAFLKAL